MKCVKTGDIPKTCWYARFIYLLLFQIVYKLRLLSTIGGCLFSLGMGQSLACFPLFGTCLCSSIQLSRKDNGVAICWTASRSSLMLLSQHSASLTSRQCEQNTVKHNSVVDNFSRQGFLHLFCVFVCIDFTQSTEVKTGNLNMCDVLCITALQPPLLWPLCYM